MLDLNLATTTASPFLQVRENVDNLFKMWITHIEA